MDREDDEIRFALGVLDDQRRIIAAGKTHRWDIVKWAVTAYALGAVPRSPAGPRAMHRQTLGGRPCHHLTEQEKMLADI
jgi:hypothetical protein